MGRALPSLGGRDRSSRRQGSRWLAFFSALLLAIQALNLAHLILAPHAVCAEHGETIEANASVSRASGAARAHDPRRSAIDAGSEEETDHNHCDIAVQCRTARAIAISIAALAQPGSEPAVAGTFASPASLASNATYRLAPKTSPPSALV
jgi:hypothetical protein